MGNALRAKTVFSDTQGQRRCQNFDQLALILIFERPDYAAEVGIRGQPNPT
jgi:hypothetical protein